MIVRALIILFLLSANIAWGQDFLSKNIALNVKNLPIKVVLDQISEEAGVYFTYAGNMEVMDKKVTLNIDKIALNRLLTDLFYGEDITFSGYSNQIILKKRPAPVKTYKVRGLIVASGSEEVVEFASLQLKQSKKGTVGGMDGKFEIEFTTNDISDSLSFYCIGYEPRTISIKALTSLEFHKIYLVPRTIELPVVEKTARKASIEKEGNKGIAIGSLYLDTHGQQVALFIENKKNINGRLKALNFYLSGKGNTEAPFRIRIYGMNDSLGCPGEELLPDILVVKPESGRGWFEVDISRYNIRFPEKGVFVAMEGIYPGDYKNYQHSTNQADEAKSNENDDYIEGTLEYGQRIGYNRFSKNETWHYSVSHTWFQLGKKLFNVMISAEIIVNDNQKNKKQKL